MRFSYPKIRPPSFYCEKETSDGLTLHYRTRRRGYLNYVVGQLHEIATTMYNVQELKIKIVKKDEKGSFMFVVLRLGKSLIAHSPATPGTTLEPLGIDNLGRVKNLKTPTAYCFCAD